MIYWNCEGNMLMFPLERVMEKNSSLRRSGTENMSFSFV
ncbi:hypothetical protein CEV32_4459 [Brucella rhizosphaerae]|uniref:Uncharacterized protein n=1 Tax=Brucella rhizosphaerae TaxID=571254 RepID=A0A256FN95_9HYPH|nr:hypothetical protein CEV32_4459 [Brucella rhizosphaerae]